jgi:hypothetical protein
VRWQQDGATDEPVAATGDVGFSGVNCREAPENLQDGVAADAVNKVFDAGKAETRRGMVGPGWSLEHGIEFPVDFPVDFEGMGFGPLVRGTTVFSDPNGVEAILVAVRDRVWRIGDGMVAEPIALPAGETIEDECELVQVFDRVLLFRGEGVDVLEWNPQQTVEDGIGAFAAIAQSPAGTFTEPIPGAEDATCFANRLFVPFDRDKIAVSDILDYTRYDSVMNQFRINAGTADAIVKLVPWTDSSMIVFKGNSIFLLTGLDGSDLATSAAAMDLTREYGLIGRQAWAKVGSDVWFLVEGAGVLSVGATINNATQARREPISRDIEAYVRRIHWAYADKAVAGYDGARFYLAVPMDGATYNNAMLVYSTISGTWQGYWQSDILDAGWMLKTDYAGGRRLLLVNRANLADWHANGAVLVLNEGFADELGGTEYEIADSLTTRAYRMGTMVQRGRMLKLALDQSTWRPSFTVKLKPDGAYEEVTVAAGVTKSRTKYYRFGVPDWVDTHVKMLTLLVSGAGTEAANGLYFWDGSQWDKGGGYTIEETQVGGPGGIMPYYMLLYNGAGPLYGKLGGLVEGQWSLGTWPPSSGSAPAPWVAYYTGSSNVNDDHATAGREDYSVVVDGLVLGSGVVTDQHQRRLEQFRIRTGGTSIQVEVSNAQGRAVQHGVRVETMEEPAGFRRGG